MAAVAGPTQFSAANVTAPGFDGFDVTPSNSTNHPAIARAIYVGVSGNIALVTPSGTVLTFLSVPVGTILPIMSIRVNSTGTTATNMIGIV